MYTRTHARTKGNNNKSDNNYSACKPGARHYYASLLILAHLVRLVLLARLLGCPLFWIRCRRSIWANGSSSKSEFQ